MNKYKYLLTYRYAEIIHDLTVEFVKRWVDYKSRTRDQMEQAARSGKQNIVEGVTQMTSDKTKIKLLGVAEASFEELLMDYEDFLRQNNLEIFQRNDDRTAKFRKIAYKLSDLSNLSHLGNLIIRPKLPESKVVAGNYLLTLCHIVTYLLNRQIKSEVEKFEKDGGFTEKLLNGRLKWQKR